MVAKYAQELKEFVDELAFRQRVAELQEMYKSGSNWNVIDSDFNPEDSYMAHEGINWSHSPWIADPHTQEVFLGQPGIHHLDLLRHHDLVGSSYNQEDIPVPWGMINHGMILTGEGEPSIAEALSHHTGLPIEKPEEEWAF